MRDTFNGKSCRSRKFNVVQLKRTWRISIFQMRLFSFLRLFYRRSRHKLSSKGFRFASTCEHSRIHVTRIISNNLSRGEGDFRFSNKRGFFYAAGFRESQKLNLKAALKGSVTKSGNVSAENFSPSTGETWLRSPRTKVPKQPLNFARFLNPWRFSRTVIRKETQTSCRWSWEEILDLEEYHVEDLALVDCTCIENRCADSQIFLISAPGTLNERSGLKYLFQIVWQLAHVLSMITVRSYFRELPVRMTRLTLSRIISSQSPEDCLYVRYVNTSARW